MLYYKPHSLLLIFTNYHTLTDTDTRIVFLRLISDIESDNRKKEDENGLLVTLILFHIKKIHLRIWNPVFLFILANSLLQIEGRHLSALECV